MRAVATTTQPHSRTQRWASFLDATICTVAPVWGLRRLQARTAQQFLGAYRGAEKGRLRGEWAPSAGSADADLLPDRPTLVERSRDLNRNNAYAASITQTLVGNIIGTGLAPQSQPDMDWLDISEDEADAFAKQAERAWLRWTPQADAQGRMSFSELQALVMRQIVENGEVLVLPLMVDEPHRPYRLALEIIESDRLGTPSDKLSDPSIRDGVELGSRGEPIAYWIRTTHPGELYAPGAQTKEKYTRYLARNKAGRPNVLHLYRVKRPGQTRGEPLFAPVMNAFKDLGDFTEAELVAARVAACFTAFVQKNDPYGAVAGNPADAQGRRIMGLEPGAVEYLGAGESITFADPKRPSGNYEPFVLSILRAIGAALGLPLELVLKDFSRTNYSSARAALLEARLFFRESQQWLAERLCTPCWQWVLEEAWLREQLPNVDLLGEYRSDWMDVSWIAPGRGWVDPVREVESSTMAVASNLSTLADECAGQGRNWEDVLRQRQRERTRMQELGLAADPPTSSSPDVNSSTDVTDSQDQDAQAEDSEDVQDPNEVPA